MSRGHGKIQQRLIAALNLNQGPMQTLELASAAFNCDPLVLTNSQLVSVRRALRILVYEGEIYDLGRSAENRRWRRWASKNSTMQEMRECRLPRGINHLVAQKH